MYNILKKLLFRLDPETSHKAFLNIMRLFQTLKKSSNYDRNGIRLSNAAGLDKNGLIPKALYSIGFDRVVVGTITARPYEGNPRPRISRSDSYLINNMGFPNDGSEKIAKRLMKYDFAVTANIMATPGYDVIEDIKIIVSNIRPVKCIDRIELNVSCPNVNCGYDLDNILAITDDLSRDIYVKVAPDMKIAESIVEIASNHKVKGLTISNTLPHKAGGISGRLLYAQSFKTQLLYRSLTDLEIIACGGIDSKEKAIERLDNGADEIQIYTGLVFRGPKLIKEINGL